MIEWYWFWMTDSVLFKNDCKLETPITFYDGTNYITNYLIVTHSKLLKIKILSNSSRIFW